MEILGVLLVLAMIIGSLAGFISLFQRGAKEARWRELEAQLALIKQQVIELQQRLGDADTISSDPVHSHLISQNPTKIEESIEAVPSEPMTSMGNLSSKINQDAIEEHTVISVDPSAVQGSPALEVTTHPNLMERVVTVARDWLLGGNTLVRSGVVILFIGISFLLKYVAEHTTVPLSLRLAGVAAAGVGLLWTGWYLRVRRAEYAWALQGGGIGVLYLTIFAAFRLYDMLPSGLAFGLLVVIALLSAALAVMQSAHSLAVLGFAAGFLAPILTSTGSGSHVALFSYYLVLNVAIGFIAFFKSWRVLNLLGFGFTFVIGTLWGIGRYTPEYYFSTEPFVVLHFLLFNAIAWLYARRQYEHDSDYVDATLIFGTPLVGFGLQYGLLRNQPFGLAYSALALALFYVGLAWWTLKQNQKNLRFLGECYIALGVGFVTLCLPLTLDGRWTSAAWAVEGVGLLWVGLRQKRRLPVWSGLLLQILGAVAFMQGWGLTDYTAVLHQNMFLGVAFIALSAWACGGLLNRFSTRPFMQTDLLERSLPVWALWGWIWWMSAGMSVIEVHLPSAVFFHALLLYATLSSLCLPYLSMRMNWVYIARLSSLLLPCMAFVLLADMTESHPFTHFGGGAWLIAILGYMMLLVRGSVFKGWGWRSPLLWIVAILGAMEWQYWAHHWIGDEGIWSQLGWAFVPMLLLLTLHHILRHYDVKPSFRQIWGWIAAVPLVVFLLGWYCWMSLNSDGQPAPLHFWPIFNPLDITLMMVLGVLLIWQRQIADYLGAIQVKVPYMLAALAFVGLNGMLLRSLHHGVMTPFRWTSIFDVPLVQMAFTFLWGLCAFLLMLFAHQRKRRIWWMAGAALMGVVVIKMFLFDLAQTGTIERIASFIGAGILLLIMGYFAPIPPSETEPITLDKTGSDG